MLDCVDIRETSAKFILRGSGMHGDICSESCERFDHVRDALVPISVGVAPIRAAIWQA